MYFAIVFAPLAKRCSCVTSRIFVIADPILSRISRADATRPSFGLGPSHRRGQAFLEGNARLPSQGGTCLFAIRLDVPLLARAGVSVHDGPARAVPAERRKHVIRETVDR